MLAIRGLFFSAFLTLAFGLSACGQSSGGGGAKFNNYSVSFNGSNQSLLSSSQLVTSYPFSISAWVKTTSTATETVAELSVSTGTATYYRIAIVSGLPRIEVANTINHFGASAVAINDGLWHHVLGVFASSTSRTLYVDGVSQATNTNNVSYSTGVNVFSIGYNDLATPGGYFSGEIDEISFFKVALAAADAVTLYNSGAAGSVSGMAGLVSWWRMGDGAGDDLAVSGTIADQAGSDPLTAANMGAGNIVSDAP